MPREIIDDIPRELGEGETATYMQDGVLVTATKHLGETYTTAARTGENTSVVDTLENFDFNDEEIGGANFTLSLSENAISVEDGSGTQRAIFGQITSTDYGIKAMDNSGNELIGLYGTNNVIAGWDVTQDYIHNHSLDNSKHLYLRSGRSDNLPRLEVLVGGNVMLKTGVIEANKSGIVMNNSSNDEIFRVDSAGVSKIGGWEFHTGLFRSASTGARIELNPTKNRMSIFDANDEKVVMGYLDGLAKNDGSGDWGSNDYGFWAKDGDSLQIDGDMQYESGDWMVQNDASLKIHDGDGDEIIRLGTYSGAKGLFIGDDIDSVAPLARYEKTKIVIGDESGEHLKYTTAGGLEITGDITVTGDTSRQLLELFKNDTTGSNSVLDTNHWAILGDLTQYQTDTGMKCWDANMNSNYNPVSQTWSSDGWDVAFRNKEAFKRVDNPVLTWDVKLTIASTSALNADQVVGGVDNRYEMIGFFNSKTNAHYNKIEYGMYFSNDDAYWYRGSSNEGTIWTNKSEYLNSTFRLVITVKYGGGAFAALYKDGDLTTPFATKDWGTTGTGTDLYIGNAVRNQGAGKLEHQQVGCGNIAPSVPTIISGGLVTTGKIQSSDNKTYFDLDNDDFRVNDGSNDRVVIGKLANNNYGVRVGYEGVNASGSPDNDDLMFSTEFPLPKYQIIYMDGRELRRAQDSFTETPYPTGQVQNTSILYLGDLADSSTTSGYIGGLQLVNPPNQSMFYYH